MPFPSWIRREYPARRSGSESRSRPRGLTQSWLADFNQRSPAKVEMLGDCQEIPTCLKSMHHEPNLHSQATQGVVLLELRPLSSATPVPLSRDPLAYVSRAISELDSVRFAALQVIDGFLVHESQVL
jgi:hypothetical protein